MSGSTEVQIIETASLSDRQRRAVRRLLQQAFAGDFSQDDWSHALGGCHAIVIADDAIVAHGAAVERRIFVGDRPYRAGYIEAVAVQPARQRAGLGSAVMAALTDVVRARFELGVLSTGSARFYERLGWERWRGPSYVRAADGRLLRSADEDNGIMVFRCGSSRNIDATLPIACESRAGDSW